MPRFIVRPDQLHDPEVILSEKESRHALSALRLKVGAAVDLMDGQGHLVQGIIGAVKEGRVRVIANQNRTADHPSAKARVTLAVSVIKSERMEWLIEKSCELGVSAIVPILTERSVIRMSRERWQSRLVRWRKIASESCKQCGLVVIPAVEEPVMFQKFLGSLNRFGLVFIPTLAVAGESLLVSYLRLKSAAPPNILGLIGPEGDFTKSEVAAAISNGAKPVSLGALTLRSETAALYFLSAVNFFYQEMTNEKIL